MGSRAEIDRSGLVTGASISSISSLFSVIVALNSCAATKMQSIVISASVMFVPTTSGSVEMSAGDGTERTMFGRYASATPPSDLKPVTRTSEFPPPNVENRKSPVFGSMTAPSAP